MRNYLREMLFGPSGPREPEGDLETAQQGLVQPLRPVNWEIREIGSEHDDYEIWRGRRLMGTVTSMAEARRFVDSAADEGDLVFHVHPDGYRERIVGKRRRWRG